MNYKLSPSDFAYLYEDCKLCYYLKIKHGIKPPSFPFPGVFSTINSIVQGQMVGKSLNEFAKDLPNIEVVKQEGFVKSKQVEGTSVFISGKYDLLADNGDGTHTLIDLKISKPDVEKIDKYKTQLYSYKYALENPQEGDSYKISKMALLIFYPESATFDDDGALIKFPAKWFEIPIDEEGFMKFIKEVDDLLAGDPPAEEDGCKLCQYRHKGEYISHEILNNYETINPNDEEDTEPKEMPF